MNATLQNKFALSTATSIRFKYCVTASLFTVKKIKHEMMHQASHAPVQSLVIY